MKCVQHHDIVAYSFAPTVVSSKYYKYRSYKKLEKHYCFGQCAYMEWNAPYAVSFH